MIYTRDGRGHTHGTSVLLDTLDGTLEQGDEVTALLGLANLANNVGDGTGDLANDTVEDGGGQGRDGQSGDGEDGRGLHVCGLGVVVMEGMIRV